MQKHKTTKLKQGDYLYRGHRITHSSIIVNQDNLTCKYDWQPMCNRRGEYDDWFISVGNTIDDGPCDYEHHCYTLTDAKNMIDNHLDNVNAGPEGLEILNRLGLAGKLMTSEEADLYRSEWSEIRAKKEEKKRDDNLTFLVGEIWSIIGSDPANDGTWTFEDTAKEVAKALVEEGYINKGYNQYFKR